MLEGTLREERTTYNLSQLAGTIVFYFGTAVTLSWVMGLPLLWFEGWSNPITRPNSGLGFLIAGLALSLVQEEKVNGVWRIPEVRATFSVRRTAQLLGLLLTALGGLTILEHLLGTDFHISTLIVLQKWLREVDSGSARMTVLTAVEFCVIGLAFIFTDVRIKRNRYPSEILAAIVLVVSLDSLIAFLYMSDSLPDPRVDSPIPLLSSAIFIILSLGMLASRQSRGIVALWSAKYAGSTQVRKWLPIGVLVFILVGEMVDILQDYGFLRPGISLSIFTVVVISFVAVVVLFAAARLNNSETELLHANKLYAVLSQSDQAIVRTRERDRLLKEVCEIMVKYGSFRMAWVSLRREPGIENVIDSCSGVGCAKFKDTRGFMGAFLDTPSVRRVLFGEEYCVFNCIETDEIPAPVMEQLLQMGHRSMSVLRLTSSGETAGMLVVSSVEAGFFREKEMALLREVALDLSFALEGMKQELQRERAESAMRASEERFRATFEQAATGIVLLTPTGIIMKANPHFLMITGYDEADLVGRSFLDITHRDDTARDIESLERITRGDIQTYSVEKRYIRKDGTPVWVHLSAAMVRGADGEPQNLISVVQDITERKEAEELLRKSREQYRKFFEEDITADFISTVGGEILSCNPAFARIFGFSSVEEALKADVKDLYLSAEQREEFLGLLQQSSKIEYREMTLKRKDGSHIFVIISAYGIFDENGALIQTKNYLFDDTRRKMLEMQMLQTQKMESLGTLAGGIAHDFNNILGIIMGHTALLKRKGLDEERTSRSLEAIDSATRRGAGLIRQLLTFARKEDRVFESIRVNEIITDLHKLLQETFPRLVTIKLQLTEDIPPIIGDPNQIHQALLNLCVNARDAMIDRKDGNPPGGTLTISSAVTDGESIRNTFPKAAGGKYVKLTVEDTGMGMDEATRAHVFEPFFTTKERGKGTGLGLATVYGIVEGHQGFVDISSRPGMGTTFTIYLPSQARGAGTEDPHDDRAETEGGSETILVVEDEEMLTDFLSEILTRKGYKVLTAPDGETAVSVFAENFKRIDLVLSDLGLPKLAGADLLNELRKIDPRVRIIFASGFLEPDTKSNITDAGTRDFIHKPYTASEVPRKIREVLNS